MTGAFSEKDTHFSLPGVLCWWPSAGGVDRIGWYSQLAPGHRLFPGEPSCPTHGFLAQFLPAMTQKLQNLQA